MSSRRHLSPKRQIAQLRRSNAQLQACLALHRQNDQSFYRSLFETMDEGFGILELLDGPHGPLSDYIHVLTNAAYTRHAGSCEVIGKSVRELIPDEAHLWVARFREVWRTGEPSHFEQTLIATGHVLSVTSFRIEPAARRQVAVLFRDVTERSKAEQLLQQIKKDLEQRVHIAMSERQLFAQLVDHSAANVHVLDTELRWLAINRQAKHDFHHLYGITPNVGDELPKLLPANQHDSVIALTLWQRALAGEQFTVTERFGQGAAQRHYELRFDCIRGDDGNVTAAFVFAYDISEWVNDQQRLQQAEQALYQARKMEAVGQLTGGIAHDFNNLLGSILGAQEVMQQRLQQQRFGELAPLLAVSNRSAERASTMVHRLLAFSRKQTLQPQPTDVRRLVDEMQYLIHGSLRPDLTLSCHFAETLWPTFVDPPQLESALLNLCLNARDALQDGGTIRIHGANVSLDTQLASELGLVAGDFICIGVEDNGLGMSTQVLERAIEPFFTTKPLGQGTGLGLSMVYGFARQSEGQLCIESELGVGTHVRLYLPRHRADVRRVEKPPHIAPKPDAGSVRVALLAYDMAMRQVIGEVVADLGYPVQALDSWRAAIDVCGQLPHPQLLIIDTELPDGLKGRQVAEQAMALRADLKVLFITGYDERAALGTGQPLPNSAVLRKPFNLEQLVTCVSKLLRHE
ncbi:PAS domain-containing protein [Pseudomonas putida]|uniref:PAS domain-containing protein n=1 Tax=Pseudomonas putida TaxID=303 RepID=UPI003CFE3ADF